MTTKTFEDRILGATRQVKASTTETTWFASGNNLAVKGDLGRRVIPIDLDAQVEQPETRSGFRYGNLEEAVLAKRPALVRAVLTILRAYHLHAIDRPAIEPFGSFEAWSKYVREPLIWLGEADPCAGRARVRAEGDPELEAWRGLLVAWIGARTPLMPASMVIADAIAFARQNSSMLKAALAALDPKGDPDRPDARRIGYVFRRYRGKIVEGLRMVGEAKRDGIEWKVEQVGGGS